ncbi:hypothetical protein DPB66_02355 [Salmonella enterica subsp. enterica serovar Java]|uniref:Uncharacterized protein n=1 Tax=Salmonella enterica TaxID=28901 RepID=A0A754B7G0_SALER|nr:hypothetical protein [Salmonella enterica]EBW3150345.1 hypothetical protein [Salmonella enterica subsp. enterica serovar Java]EDU1195090.1 hypothetical protein [Salmonella enterica subsp. enterica serovar Heidelberg str. CFSAN000576]EDV9851779.1 hypothetical protein [Salmonella enterica subsp. enterica serovar Java]HAF8579056.1 hypothetical protein [Salmonella enterica]
MTIAIGFNLVRPATGLYVQGMIALGEGTPLFSATLLAKLRPENSTGLGSTSVQGNVLTTRSGPESVLSAVNTYLTDKLTGDELKIILNNRDKFEFAIGVGDRRSGVVSRFVIASNWHGEDVNNLLLLPNPPNAPEYDFRLTFSADTGTLTLTDNHVLVPNTYGGMRYLTVRVKP